MFKLLSRWSATKDVVTQLQTSATAMPSPVGSPTVRGPGGQTAVAGQGHAQASNTSFQLLMISQVVASSYQAAPAVHGLDGQSIKQSALGGQNTTYAPNVALSSPANGTAAQSTLDPEWIFRTGIQ